MGISNAKRVISEQVQSNRFCVEFNRMLPSSNNMIFVGNAGTGKTTTAKLFAEMLFSIGVVKSPRVKFIAANELFVQDVTTKLGEICKEAMGGILFIDEIYLLQPRLYLCTEVISVLLDMLENKKEDLTIILAGYEQQMESFLNENQGLKSRFPITVHFDDFTEDELYQIFEQNCAAGGMEIHPGVKERFLEIIREEKRKDGFGNGRLVRNIYEQAFRRHAVNYYDQEGRDPNCITPEDIERLEDVNKRPSSIGFV